LQAQPARDLLATESCIVKMSVPSQKSKLSDQNEKPSLVRSRLTLTPHHVAARWMLPSRTASAYQTVRAAVSASGFVCQVTAHRAGWAHDHFAGLINSSDDRIGDSQPQIVFTGIERLTAHGQGLDPAPPVTAFCRLLPHIEDCARNQQQQQANQSTRSKSSPGLWLERRFE